jgi:protein O-mannosyl-transferase
VEKKAAPKSKPTAKQARGKTATAEAPSLNVLSNDPKFPAWLSDFRMQAILVAVLCVICYANTIGNEAAHDDTMVIEQNEYVLEGLAGIPKILTKDSYDSYMRQFGLTNGLSGGRYRPLSIITFALEQQFFGAIQKSQVDSYLSRLMTMKRNDPEKLKRDRNMHVRHCLNLLFFVASMIALLYFLRSIVFRGHSIMALIAALLFAAHPIHTEAVANVKSRDEILSLLFISLAFILVFKYQEDKRTGFLLSALLAFFLALLSKEYAITMLALIPLALYLFNRCSLKDSVKAALPFLAAAGGYLWLRLQVVGEANKNALGDILNNPYLFASDSQRIATKISTALNYLKLLLYPHPLSADYSYNAIPYKDMANPLVWFSLLIHMGLILAFFYYFKRRHVLAFAIAFYLLNLLLICNLIFDIGATMGERLIFLASTGFVIATAYFLCTSVGKIKSLAAGKTVLVGIAIAVLGLYSFKTIERNRDWKNDWTLFAHDIKVVPNSVLACSNVAAGLIDRSTDERRDEAARKKDLYEALALLDKTVALHPTYITSYVNRALVCARLGQPDSELENLEKVRSLHPKHPALPDLYYTLGVLYFKSKKEAMAVHAWKTVLQLNPEHARARNNLAALQAQGAIGN